MFKEADLLWITDPGLVTLQDPMGAVLLSPVLGGRIFCRIGSELVHRLDCERLANPSPSEFNNLGGNSLWPAPEGGPFAFNYPPASEDWYVQDGVAQVPARLTQYHERSATMEKSMALVNRRGILVRLGFKRQVFLKEIAPGIQGFDLRGLCYGSVDTLTPLNSLSAEKALVAAWSLEQFPGADGTIAFGKVARPEECINLDYYGEPGDRIQYREGGFTFLLGGTDRHQIGVKADAGAELIGALDRKRGLLMLRRTQKQAGTYFNIADNEQSEGPLSAADLYSIFNGGELGFFELETIAPMKVKKEILSESQIESETVLLKGEIPELIRYLADQVGLPFAEDLK